jgi:hypothetical protein
MGLKGRQEPFYQYVARAAERRTLGEEMHV